MIRILPLASVALMSGSVFAQSMEVKLNAAAIVVHDLAETKRLYSSLGFIMAEGHPTRSASGFREGGGIEFAERRDQSEGPRDADLEVASAQQAADVLSAAGLKMGALTPGSRIMQRPTGQVTVQWVLLRFADDLDSRPFYLVQLLNPEVLVKGAQPNSASSLAAILVAVNDAERAAAGYANVGKLSNREIPLPEFGAAAKEIVLARGSILLLTATDPSGPTARYLKGRGEGILGVRLGVSDLAQTRRVIGEKNVSKDMQSVLVAPENAAGAWLQFQATH
jgi:hypothetical protein